MDRPVWRSVISSIEDALPFYDEVNEVLSLKRASKARTYAIRRLLEHGKPKLVLDSGTGPRHMSVLLLENDANVEVVALDYSSRLLKACTERLACHRDRVHFVRGCFEELPFRSSTFDAAATAYALRDSQDLSRAITEYARSIKNRGRLAVVELGKPENAFRRLFATMCVGFIALLIAETIVSGRLKDNLWRAIAPTYRNLPSTDQLLQMLRARFGLLEKREFLAGGMLIVLLRSFQA